MLRSQTSYTLWQKEIHSAHSSSRLPKADINLHVVEVLHTAYSASSLGSSSNIRSVLTRCHVLDHLTHRIVDDSSDSEKRPVPIAEGYVLFSLTAGGVGANNTTVHTPSKGSYISVWKPFYEVQLPINLGFDISNAESNDGSNSVTETPGALDKLSSALLCSRFLILSSQKSRT